MAEKLRQTNGKSLQVLSLQKIAMTKVVKCAK